MKKIISLFILCILAMPITSQASEAISGAFGVNMHLANRFSQDDWDDAVEKAKNNGVQWAREEFNWSTIEPSDDVYNWDVYDSVVDTYDANGIKVLGLITYSTSWSSSNPGSADYEYYAPDLTAWKDYVENLAERYAGKVDHWEIWNEPNYDGFWKDDQKQYVAHLEAAAKKIKAVNSNAKIILGGLSGSDTDYLQGIYDEISDKDYFDAIAVHPYRVVNNNFNYSPEETVDGLNMLQIDLANIRAVAKQNGDKNKAIWLTEFGWTSYDDGVTEKMQADYLLRGYAMALTISKVKKVFWYSFADSSDDSSYLESNFGLVKNDLDDKDALETYNFLQAKLNGKKYQHSSLANATVLDNFNTPSGWEFSGSVYADGKITENVNGKLKVYYDFFGSDNSYLPIHNKIKMPTNTKALSFKAKGNNDNTFLRVRIKDAKNEVFQYNLGYLPKNLTTYRINLTNYSANWNGDEDGVLDQPLYFQSFILDDNPDGSLASGDVYFDDLESSKKASIYLYKYKKGKKYYYLLWNKNDVSKYHTIKIPDVTQIRVKTLKTNKLKKSFKNKFRIKVSSRPKWIVVKK